MVVQTEHTLYTLSKSVLYTVYSQSFYSNNDDIWETDL